MQLFTVGLWELHADGTLVLDENGAPTPTYGQDNIDTFARVWTGFEKVAHRGNIEHPTQRPRLHLRPPHGSAGPAAGRGAHPPPASAPAGRPCEPPLPARGGRG